jgi:putative redox protein
MEMVVDFPGGSRVDAHFDGFTLRTDQPSTNGGAGTAPSPFDTFLASIGTCAGIYVLGFCKQRGIPTEGIRIVEKPVYDKLTGMVATIQMEIQLPAGFPEKYRSAVIRSADQCKVKKHMEHPPAFEIEANIAEAVAA